MRATSFGEYTYEELTKRLEESKVDTDQLTGGETAPLFNVFMAVADHFTISVSNYIGMTDIQKAEFFTVAPKLFVYGLVRNGRFPGRAVFSVSSFRRWAPAIWRERNPGSTSWLQAQLRRRPSR